MPRHAVLVLVLCCALLAPAGPAGADAYRVRLCTTDRAATAGEDLVPTLDSGLLTGANRCPVDRQVQLNARARRAWPPGGGGQWTLAAPPGTRLIKAHVRLEGRSVDGVQGMADVVDGTRSLKPRNHHGPAPVDYDWWGEGSALVVRLRCLPWRRAGCRTGSVASYLLARNFDVTLLDAAPPAPPEATGPLAGGTWVRGPAELGYATADVGGGVDRVQLRVDGQLVRTEASPCQRADGVYSRGRPCPADVRGVTSLDTARLADGEHALDLEAVDAAGGRTARSLVARVDNTPPGPPVRLEADPPGWTNVDRFALRWRNPDQRAGSPVAGARVRVGGGEPRPVPGRDLLGVEGVAALRDGETPVAVSLVDEAGNFDDERPATTVLRYDGTPPEATFADPDPQRPAQVRALLSDATSGLVAASLAYRRAGEPGWHELPAELRDSEVAADFPDAVVAPAAYEVRATATDRAGNRVEAHTQVEAPMRRATRVEAGLRRRATDPPRPRLTVGPGERAVVTGRVVDSDGQPVAGLGVALEERVDRPGARPRRAGEATTGADGVFELPVGAGPSRRLRVATAGSEAFLPSQAGLRVLVRAGVSLSLSPRRLRNGSRLRFRGGVAAARGHLPRAGKLVVLQFLDRPRWRPVAVVRTDRRGRFRAAHRFRTVRAATRFTFRALAPAEAGFPYAPGASRARSAVVLPRR